MKEKYLKELYKFDQESKSYHVVIDLDTYRDAYSEWDYSPLSNREMDDDLLEYLMDSSVEIGCKKRMMIDFYIPESLFDASRERKSIQGFRAYFRYRIRKIQSERLRLLRQTLVLFLLGIVFLSSAAMVNRLGINPFVGEIVSEGLFIGAWVAIWEIFSTVYFEVNNLSQRIKHFRRLEATDIHYYVKSS